MNQRPPRVPFQRPLAITPIGQGNGDERRQLEALNLSLGGLFVKADEAPPLGTPISLELGAGGRYLGFAEGEVAWVRTRGDRGFGVRFTQLKPNAQALVEHLVARGGTGETKPHQRRRGVLVGALLLLLAAGGALALRHKPRIEYVESPPVRQNDAPVPTMSVAPRLTALPGDFQFALPTGAVSGLRVIIDDREVAVTPTLHKGASVQRIFKLEHPARLVIDVAGRQPRYSWQLEGSSVVKSVRVGARNHGTRVVVDLPELEGKGYRVATPTS
jgi:hypothetical protein